MSYEPKNDPSNPDAYPVMCTLNMWGGWSIQEWIQWHGAMKARYSLDYANRAFLIAWEDDGIVSGPPLQERNFNTAFRDYARANGFFDGLYYGLGALTKPLGTVDDVLDGISGIGQAVKNVGKAAENTSKASNWLLPLALVAVAALFLWPQIVRAKTAGK